MTAKYRNDYPQIPIGDGNPYYKCAKCNRSVPEINGEVIRHEKWCEWRKYIEYDEFRQLTNNQVDLAIDKILSDKNRRIRLAIEMLENDLDKDIVIAMLKKAME